MNGIYRDGADRPTPPRSGFAHFPISNSVDYQRVFPLPSPLLVPNVMNVIFRPLVALGESLSASRSISRGPEPGLRLFAAEAPVLPGISRINENYSDERGDVRLDILFHSAHPIYCRARARERPARAYRFAAHSVA